LPSDSVSGSISADPEVCLIAPGERRCSTTISWETKNANLVYIDIGFPDKYARPVDQSGSQVLDWINRKGYTIYLYDYNYAEYKILDSVFVKGEPSASGSIDANPNPCSIAPKETLCSSTISWTSQDAPDAYVGIDGIEKVFSRWPSGAEVVDWITESGYSFNLYDSYIKPKLLDKVFVKGEPLASGSISANPNPCLIAPGEKECSSTITWTSQNAPDAFVGVESTEKVFSTGSSGTVVVDWITKGGYNFNLYDSPLNSKLLASVFVKGKPLASGSISASPNPCNMASGETRCSSTITWTSQNAPDAYVGVGSTERVFSNKPSGTEVADWITESGYSFNLYDSPYHSNLLDLVFVRGKPFINGSISAEPIPCIIPSGEEYCRTTLYWETENVDRVFIGVSTEKGEEVGPSGHFVLDGVKEEKDGWAIYLFDFTTYEILDSVFVYGVLESDISGDLDGDLDGDSDVDYDDFVVLVQNFGRTDSDNPADIDGDSDVDIFDYNALVEHFGI
jgi:hypothetical protein